MENVNEKIDDGFSMESIANNALDALQPNKLMQGEVVTIDSEFVYVNVGTKSDGRVRIQEFAAPPAVGDTSDIVLAERRMVDGMFMFSNTAAVREKGWRKLMDLRTSGQEYLPRGSGGRREGAYDRLRRHQRFSPVFTGGGPQVQKGGGPRGALHFQGKRASIPKTLRARFRREYLDETREKFWAGIVENHKVGDRIKGKVRVFVEFGAFVDIGGVGRPAP